MSAGFGFRSRAATQASGSLASDGAFGLVYLLSVFTHFPERLQLAWIGEFARILRPGGYLLFSTLGEYYAGLDRLAPAERETFDDGHLVVLFDDHAGESFCSAYHPREYVVETLARELDYVGFRLAMIPEPSTGLLVVAGLLGLGGWRRVST